MCFQIYALDPDHFLSAPELTWQAALKKENVKLDLLSDINMLLMLGNDVNKEIYHAIHRYVKANNK